MNKKGFTLIELLSVVTLIVLISLIVLPNVVSNINKKKGELSEANMKLLSQATDVYIGNHGASYTNSFEADGSVYCISIQSLINDGVLETPFKDVRGNEIDYSNIVRATYSSTYNSFIYEMVSNGSCTEFINYVSRPVLASSMIPVINDNGVWKKADVNSKWYSYSDKKWANAVVVKEFKSDVVNSHSRYEYLESPAGTVINDDDILGFYVWIPRFRYQLFNSSTPVPINIVFEGVGSSKSNGTQSGQWLTHPAFTYKDKELSGVWVAKYEASNSDDNIVVKSGNAPWTNIGFNDSFDLSNSMINENNIYGLSNVNTHLIQNKEWSSVTYLTQSIYGLNDKVNTNSSSVTGGTNSTTGNIYGVYDMAGLSNEFVTITGENENSIGYSLGETNAWYGDTNSFINDTNSYLSRGGTSIFNYSASNVKNANTSFRPVIINNEVSSDNQNTSLQYAYQNISTNSYYSTLQDAFSEAHNGDTVKVLGSTSDNSVPVVSSGKSVSLDLNGCVLSMNNSITNNGTFIITGSGELRNGTTSVIVNTGTFIKNGSSSITHFASNSHAISSTGGEIVINDGLISTDGGVVLGTNNTTANGPRAINTTGNFTMTGGTVKSSFSEAVYVFGNNVLFSGGTVEKSADVNGTNHTGSAFVYTGSGTAAFNGGTIKVSSGGSGTLNHVSGTGTIEINGATVKNEGTGQSVVNAGTSSESLIINSGTISSVSANAVRNNSTGTVKIYDGTISSQTSDAISNSSTGIIEISGGTVTSSNKAGISLANGTINITGGTIQGTTYAVWINTSNSPTLTLGTDDSTINSTPSLNATNATGNGVSVGSGTFNFYDGTVVGGYSGGTGYSITGSGTVNTPEGYSVSKTNNGSRETAVLVAN